MDKQKMQEVHQKLNNAREQTRAQFQKAVAENLQKTGGATVTVKSDTHVQVSRSGE